jgi:hypothetical protein
MNIYAQVVPEGAAAGGGQAFSVRQRVCPKCCPITGPITRRQEMLMVETSREELIVSYGGLLRLQGQGHRFDPGQLRQIPSPDHLGYLPTGPR